MNSNLIKEIDIVGNLIGADDIQLGGIDLWITRETAANAVSEGDLLEELSERFSQTADHYQYKVGDEGFTRAGDRYRVRLVDVRGNYPLFVEIEYRNSPNFWFGEGRKTDGRALSFTNDLISPIVVSEASVEAAYQRIYGISSGSAPSNFAKSFRRGIEDAIRQHESERFKK